MDLASKVLSMSASPPPPPSSDPGFPVIAVALIGILATAFLLVSYYVFAVKCRLNGHRVDLVFGRFWVFRRSRRDGPLLVYSPPRVQARGLDEAVIRSIPVRNFKSRGSGGGGGEDWSGGGRGERRFCECECAVCLNEFQEDEKLKVIPSCCHAFHVDCIDIWLQNNANCPLCRTSISSVVLFPFDTLALAPRSSSPDNPVRSLEAIPGAVIGGDEDFVVIEFNRGNGEGPESPESFFHLNSISPRDSPVKSEKKTELPVKGRKRDARLRKMTSLGDESIYTRTGGDGEFPVQPMRRSISMDSAAADGALLLAVQEALSQRKEVIDEQGCSTSNISSSSNNNNIKIRRSRSFFSFGHHGRVPRSSAAVQPISF